MFITLNSGILTSILIKSISFFTIFTIFSNILFLSLLHSHEKFFLLLGAWNIFVLVKKKESKLIPKWLDDDGGAGAVVREKDRKNRTSKRVPFTHNYGLHHRGDAKCATCHTSLTQIAGIIGIIMKSLRLSLLLSFQGSLSKLKIIFPGIWFYDGYKTHGKP